MFDAFFVLTFSESKATCKGTTRSAKTWKNVAKTWKSYSLVVLSIGIFREKHSRGVFPSLTLGQIECWRRKAFFCESPVVLSFFFAKNRSRHRSRIQRKRTFFRCEKSVFFSCATRIPQTSCGIHWWPGKAPGTATQATSRGSLRAAGDARNRFRSRFVEFLFSILKLGIGKVARFCLFRRNTDRFFEKGMRAVASHLEPQSARSRKKHVFSKGLDRFGRSVSFGEIGSAVQKWRSGTAQLIWATYTDRPNLSRPFEKNTIF